MPTADREEALFAAALEKPTRAERAAYLEGACGGDFALRARLEALLAAHQASGGVLDVPPSALPTTTAYRPLTEGPGSVIGPYKLLQQIGEGGMGVVYMAEQQEPVRRKVALKIIKPGLDSHQVIARFEAERQALALMDHQNIARVLDAGTTGEGARGEGPGPSAEAHGHQFPHPSPPASRPYFVMELVHGVPITKFCDDNKLTPRERLALFVPVCHAIQHAHQKGIIHRDVKPSNVLVTMYDDKPVPKVIDFGVAKAIEQRLTEKTMFTQFGALVGTFEYMSPEQAEMNAFGVDTRSDIYSLGVLLYELLTGTTPLERKRLREAALDELVRLIREEEAPRPSARLSSSNNLLKIAAARNTEPARLSKLVRGEIDWIVMKCLEKDRSRRYETANGVARDLERYLADEPVEACPPSAHYRLTKFAHKYKKALITVAAFAVILVAFAATSIVLAVRATSAEHEADRQVIASDAAKQHELEARLEADKQRDKALLTAYASGMNLAQRAWEENDIVRARELLEEVPREAAGRNLRGFEWYYLSRLCHRDELTLLGHAANVYGVAFSPGGQRLASGSDDKTVKIWDSATGKELLTLQGHAAGVWSVAFSPDGQRLASGSDDKTVKIWDSATGNGLLTLHGHAGGVRRVVFSPDGQRLASGSDDKTVKIWDSATGKELLTLQGHAANVNSVAFSPDGQRLASGSDDKTVKIWDSATGKELFALKGHAGWVMSVAFSPDGQRLASGSMDKAVKIWDSATGKELLTLQGHAGGVDRVAFSPEGQRLASAGSDGAGSSTVKIWDSATGTELFSLKQTALLLQEGGAQFVGRLAFLPDGPRLYSSEYVTTVTSWDSLARQELFALNGHEGHVWSVAFSPDGQRLASGSGFETVKIWDSLSGKELFALKRHADSIGPMFWSVAFSPDGQRLASGSGYKTVKIWDSATGKELFALDGHADMVTSVAFSPDGQRLASGSFDQTVKIWDTATGKQLFSFPAGAVTSVAFSPDGQRLASAGSDQTVKLWDSATGKELFTLKGHVNTVTSVAFSPDGLRLASGSWDQTVKIWDSATGKELFTLKGHANTVNSVAFSPDGLRLASGSFDQTVKIWDTATGKQLLTLKGHKGHAGPVWSVVFSPDGQRLASGNSGFIDLWETSVSPEIQHRRATNQMVADLFRLMFLRADVLERLRTLPGMSPSRRQEAISIAQAYPHDPMALTHRAWELVRLPGRGMPNYQKALHYSEEACQVEQKNGYYLNTLGVAYYRVGNFEKALATLLRSEQINKTQLGSLPADLLFHAKTQQQLGHLRALIPTDLAFLAMTHQQLGHVKEAQTEFQRLRERMKDPRWTEDAEAQGFLREAVALLANPKAPGGK